MPPEDSLRTQARRALRRPGPRAAPRPDTLEEAAEQFEKVLIRHFVEVMTDDLFKASFSGKEGPQWMDSQRDTQRDVLTDVLVEHLGKADVLDFSELLLQKWGHVRAPAGDGPSPFSSDQDEGAQSIEDRR